MFTIFHKIVFGLFVDFISILLASVLTISPKIEMLIFEEDRFVSDATTQLSHINASFLKFKFKGRLENEANPTFTSI